MTEAEMEYQGRLYVARLAYSLGYRECAECGTWRYKAHQMTQGINDDGEAVHYCPECSALLTRLETVAHD